MLLPDVTHQPTQTPTHPPNHTLILGVPLGIGRWVDGDGVGTGVWAGIPCMHTCTNMHACMHMHVKHAKHDKHGCLHVGGHLQFLYMYTCVCMHVCACTCVYVHVGTKPQCPQMPKISPHPPAPSPQLQGAQDTKIQ